MEKTVVVRGREGSLWVEGIYEKPLGYEWHLSFAGFDDEGRADTIEAGIIAAEQALKRFRGRK